MKHRWIARAGAVLLVGVVVVVICSAEGVASTRRPGDAVAPVSPSSGVIANRPAVYALPNGCGPAGKKFRCNPLTNAGCDRAKDEACDDDDHGGFGCYPGPNSAKEGGECDDDRGCQGGLGCDMDDGDEDGICARYCCTDADCGSKKCVVIDKAFGSLGFCN
jgi:hypothetical protein